MEVVEVMMDLSSEDNPKRSILVEYRHILIGIYLSPIIIKNGSL